MFKAVKRRSYTTSKSDDVGRVTRGVEHRRTLADISLVTVTRDLVDERARARGISEEAVVENLVWCGTVRDFTLLHVTCYCNRP